MSWLRAVLFASPLMAGGVVIACKSAEEPRPSDLLDCDWARSTANCWKPFVTTIDRCLANSVDGGIVPDAPVGVISTDRKSCVYPDGGRTVIGSVRLDQPLEGVDGGEDRRAFVVRLASGEVCLQYDQTGSSATLVGPDGALNWENEGGVLTIKCPDGRVVRGPNTDLLDCLEPGELPGTSSYNTPDGAFFQLLGMTGPVYACQAPPDSGADGD